MTPRRSSPCPKTQRPDSRTVGIDRSPEKSPPLASSTTPSKLANTASLRQATSGRYRPSLNYQNVKWCTFRLPRWCIFNLPKTKPAYIEAIARKKRGEIPQIQKPDIEGEKFRQKKCLRFLADLSKGFPTVWLKIFDSRVLEASLFLDGKQFGTFVYPWHYHAENPVELKLKSKKAWPELASLPSSEVEFWESSEDVAQGRKFSALAKHVGWRPESVEIGFTVDSKRTNFWYAVPDDYDLLCYSRQ